MKASPDLVTIYQGICKATEQGDHAFFKELFSKREGVLAVGTDPAEWWEGYEDIVRVFTAQLKEAGGFKMTAGDSAAWEEGPMGWVAGRPVLTLPDGTEVPLRMTVVFAREPGGWKAVQYHLSTGPSNEDLLGEALTT